jgi:dynein assembly factor 5
LDDSQDDIRRQALKTFVTFFDAIGRWQSSVKDLVEFANEATTIKDDTQECGFREIKLDSVHWETMLKGMAIHLDDMNKNIQVTDCFNTKIYRMIAVKHSLLLLKLFLLAFYVKCLIYADPNIGRQSTLM